MSKKRRNQGFSLAEVLIAILIMTMVTIVTANGIPSATRVYKKVMDAANAQILMSTTTNTLRGWLDQAIVDEAAGTSTILKTEDDTQTTVITVPSITFNTAATGLCRISSEAGGIKIEEYLNSGTDYPKRMLVASTAGGGDLYPVFTNVSYVKNTIIIEGLSIVDKNGTIVLGPTSFTTKTFGN